MIFFKKNVLGYQAIPKCNLNTNFQDPTTKTVAYSAWTDGRTDRQTDGQNRENRGPIRS